MIKLIIDTTNSIKELGKKDSLEMVVKSIIDELELYRLEYKVIDFGGKEIDYRDIKLEDKKLDFDLIDDNSILISDGLFEVKEIKKGVAIPIGIDTDIVNLKQIANEIFGVDDILRLSDYILYNFNIAQKQDEEDDEDEW